MKKVFLAIVFVSAFGLVFKETSNASSLEVFSFTGYIYQESSVYDPTLPKVGDKFAGQLSYEYDPMLEPDPNEPAVYYPENSFIFQFDYFTMTGSAYATLGYEPAGEGMTFLVMDANGTPFQIEDIFITIGDVGGQVNILAWTDSPGNIHDDIWGTMDWVSYSSIPMNSQPVPEPASFILLGFGLLGYVGSRYKCKKK